MSQITVNKIQGLTTGGNANTIVLNTDSTDRVTVDSIGRVGINTTSHYDNSTKITAAGRINTSNGTVTGSMNYGGGSVVNIGAMTNHPVQIMSNNQTILLVDTSGLSFDDGSNYLDDYEEGTWTPAWANGSGQSYTRQYGTYVKIGRQVTVTCFIQTADMNGQTGDAVVGGLPFTASTATFSTLPRAWGTINGDNNWDTNLSTNNLVAQIGGGDNVIRPRYNSGSNTSDVQLQQIGGGNSYFGTTVTYETDS